MTTTTKTTWHICDADDSEHAGTSYGATAREALETFNRDACMGEGEIVETPSVAHPVALLWRDHTLVADDEAAADPYPVGATDPRYTAERLASYSRDEILSHLNERKAQRDRAKRDMSRCHATLEALTDPDSEAYTTTIADLGSYTREHATLNRVIRHLEARANQLEIADESQARIDLIDEAILRELPVTLSEAGDLALARSLWNRVVTAAETFGDEEINVIEAAQRVADLYSRIWNPPSITVDLDEDDARHLAEYLRDAAAEAEREDRRTDWTIRVVRQIDRQTK